MNRDCDPLRNVAECLLSRMDLSQLGWDDNWASLAAKLADGFAPARVVSEEKHSLLLVSESGPVQGVTPGKMLREGLAKDSLPKVGDWVCGRQLPGEEKWLIQTVLPRRTCLQRKTTGRETESQVLATNIDVVFVVQALDSTLNLRRLERVVALAKASGAVVVALLNKSDLCPKWEAEFESLRVTLGDTDSFVTSAKSGRGLGEIRRQLRVGRTAVFLGSSGVGKSSLINRLYGEAVQDT